MEQCHVQEGTITFTRATADVPAAAAGGPVCRSAGLEETEDISGTYPADRLLVQILLGLISSTAPTCWVDLGTRGAALTITTRPGQHVWSSRDCPTPAQAHQWYRLQSTSLVIDYQWPATTSTAGCSGTGHRVTPGTYQVDVGIKAEYGAAPAPTPIAVTRQHSGEGDRRPEGSGDTLFEAPNGAAHP
ncbi:hypothetical protein ACEZDB_12180 [Streptacidiphilus sp. N1-3]|uniref:Uncharacterized protein n=1 Tax=Streptacidiphilus alkalitolerans TaxID=3342712 RepID=A0ABV6WZP1_9ACTN